jgi:DHA2 family multidrug resistance protein
MDPVSDWKPKANPWLIAISVALGAFMEMLDTSIANVALPHIAGSLGATYNESTWVLTSYLTANAISLCMSGWFANRFGRKRFFMTCVAIFTAASVLCGLSPTLGILILCRVLQGAAGGVLQPLAQAILADTFPPSKRGLAFTAYGLTAVVAPALGPTLGGWITDNFSWPWIFFINVPVGLLTLGLLYQLLEDPPYMAALAKSGARIDAIGIGLLALGVGSLQIFLDKGQECDWLASNYIVTLMVICAVCLTALVFWDWCQKDPVVDVRLFADPNFALANMIMFATGILMFAGIVLMPMFLQSLMGYNATTAGLVLSGAACFLFITFPLTAWLGNKMQGRFIIAIGAFLLAAAMAYSAARTNTLSLDFGTAVWLMITQQALIPLVWLPINLVAFVGMPPEKSNSVSSLLNFMRNIGNSVGTSMVTTLIARGLQTYQVQLAAHVNIYNPKAQFAFQVLVGTLGDEKAALAVLAKVTEGQSVVLAYVHTYEVLGGVAAFILLSAFLLRANKPGEGEVRAVH